jgi:hypothetical protein
MKEERELNQVSTIAETIHRSYSHSTRINMLGTSLSPLFKAGLTAAVMVISLEIGSTRWGDGLPESCTLEWGARCVNVVLYDGTQQSK